MKRVQLLAGPRYLEAAAARDAAGCRADALVTDDGDLCVRGAGEGNGCQHRGKAETQGVEASHN